jgi:hypothetical protein
MKSFRVAGFVLTQLSSELWNYKTNDTRVNIGEWDLVLSSANHNSKL